MKTTVQKLLTTPASGAHLLLREPCTQPEITPDEDGNWSHPDFRWDLIPEETDITQFFEDAGYELKATIRRPVPSQEEQGSRGWKPPRVGKNWFLIMIQDTEDGAQAVYAKAVSRKRISQVTEVTFDQ